MDDRQQEARRFVQRKRRFYTILVVYLALSLLWFAIDMLTGTDDLWFYWPVLGAGLIVAVIGIAMFGLGGLFGADWERRQLDKYLERRGPGENSGDAQADGPPAG
jgi:TctA family transporter